MNTFGTSFRLTTFGESHGTAIGGIVDGCPAGIAFDSELLATEMQRRHLGDGATPRHEPDEVEILSGVYQGKTLGTPIAFLIRNSDTRSEDYDALSELFRPGHADFTTIQRYGTRDPRGGGRASARETAARVAAGAIAKMFLNEHHVSIQAEVTDNGPDNIQHGLSRGGIIKCTVTSLPAGIGDPVFGKLNARLAAAMISIPSAIGFEMGIGFAAAQMSGSDFRDEWNEWGDSTKEPTQNSQFSIFNSQLTKTNHCGGIQGGISNGMPITFRAAFHPVCTLNIPTECIDKDGNTHTITPSGRHDTNHIPRTVVIVEAMTALTLADCLISNNSI